MLLDVIKGVVSEIVVGDPVTGMVVGHEWVWFRTSRSRRLPLKVGDTVTVVIGKSDRERLPIALRFRRQDGRTFAPHRHSSIPLQIAASILMTSRAVRAGSKLTLARKAIAPLMMLGAPHLIEQTSLVGGFAAKLAAKRNRPRLTNATQTQQIGVDTQQRIALGFTGAQPSPDHPWWHSELLEYTQDAIIIWEMDGAGILYWNQAAEQLYGYSREEAQGKVTHDLLRTVTRKPVGEVESVLARYGVWVGELRHTTRDGRCVDVEGRMSLMSQRNGRWLVLEVNRDVTDRRRADVAEAVREASMSGRKL
jgi:PAS domain S-box-containing protein